MAQERGPWMTNLKRGLQDDRIALYEEHGAVIGPPMPNKKFTEAELERMGVVGIYRKLGE